MNGNRLQATAMQLSLSPYQEGGEILKKAVTVPTHLPFGAKEYTPVRQKLAAING